MLRFLCAALLGTLLALQSAGPVAAQTAPDEMIRTLSMEIIERIKQDKDLKSGDIRRLSQFADETIMPNVNFERMTALAVGRNWRQASPEQQKQLMAEFRQLLLRTYAGALTAVNDDTEVVVRTEIVQSRGDPIQLDYRLEKSGTGWRIYDLNVLGVWLVETYRNQFNQEISAKGIDGLIKSLADRNRQFAQAKAS